MLVKEPKSPVSKKRQIVKNAGFYTVLSYTAQLLDVPSGILLRRFLGPVNMGIWAFLQVILNYTRHSSLGIAAAVNRDVPYYQMKEDYRRANEIKDIVFSFTMIMTFAAAACLVLWAFWNRVHLTAEIFYGLLAISVLIIMQRLYNLFVVLLRANKQFKVAGTVNFYSSALNILLTVLLVWKFKLWGLFLSLILNNMLLIRYIIAKTGLSFRWTHPFRGAKPLITLGLVLLASDMITTIIMSIDRIMITKYLGFERLGIYSIALMAFNYLSGFPRMVNVVLYPHFQEEYAQGNSPDALDKYLRKSVLCMAFSLPFLIAFVWIVSPCLTSLILPKFDQGIPALQILSIGSFFFAMTHSFNTFLVTIRKEWVLIPSQLIVLVIGFPCVYAALKLGWGIEGVAIAMSATFCFMFVFLALLSMKEIYSYPKMAALYGKVFFAFFYFLGTLWILCPISHGPATPLLQSLFQYFLFCVLNLPLLYLAEREAGFLPFIQAYIRKIFLKPLETMRYDS